MTDWGVLQGPEPNWNTEAQILMYYGPIETKKIVRGGIRRYRQDKENRNPVAFHPIATKKWGWL